MGSLNFLPLNPAVRNLQPLLPGAPTLASGSIELGGKLRPAGEQDGAFIRTSQFMKLTQLQQILRTESRAGRFVCSQPLGCDFVGEHRSQAIWRL